MNKLQTVRDALVDMVESVTGVDQVSAVNEAHEAIAIVKEMMAQEPVAWRYDLATYMEGDVRGRCWHQAFSAHKPNMPWLTKDVTPLYVAPVAVQAVPAGRLAYQAEVFAVFKRMGMSEVYPLWQAVKAIGTETVTDPASIRAAFEKDDAAAPDMKERT